MKKPLIIVDCYGFVFRAYHIHQELTINGKFVGALYGFTSMMLKLLSDFKPELIAVVLDSGKKNFRHHLFPQYKANRPEAPENLKSQLILIRDMLKVFHFPVVQNDEFEADDLIASLAESYAKNAQQVIIISSDKDMLQLMSDYIKIYDPIKMKFISEEDVITKFGVKSNQMRDFQALIGDSSDNIPGVRGVGIKTASKLIYKFGNIDKLLNSLDQIESAKQRKLIENAKANLLLSFQLVGLKTDIKLDDIDYRWKIINSPDIAEFFRKYHFKSLYKRAESILGLDITKSIEDHLHKVRKNYQLLMLDRISDLSQIINDAQNDGFLSLFFENTEGILYIFVDNTNEKNFIYQLEINNTKLNLQIFWDILISSEVKKITFDFKNLLHNIPSSVSCCDDILVMDYVLNTGKKNRHISHIMMELGLEDLDLKDNFQYLTYYKKIFQTLETKLVIENSYFLYHIEIHISRILYDMEISGILLDQRYLFQMSRKFSEQISVLEQKIFEIAGTNFNISSPKQLADILFNKMNLPYGKISSKSQNFSTNVEILEKLSLEGHQIAGLILEYRHLSKLNNTYAEALPKHVNLTDQKIHSHFIQTQTSTGRITSTEPNLQNIPIKTLEGSLIRRAFIAPDGSKIFSSDYSQIELKILAAIADVKLLKQAFHNNEDIHIATASEIFSLPKSDVTKDLRYKAKTINFSIIYGIKSFTLAQRLNIAHKEAEEYISRYFHKYPEIKQYMDKIIYFVKQHQYVKNFFGRKIYIPEITSTNFQLREFAKRAAINAPIQSCAAEIIKIAMISISKEIKRKKLNSKILIQIHDELVFEVKDEESEEMSSIIVNNMKKSFTLDIPIDVSLRKGQNFLDLQ